MPKQARSQAELPLLGSILPDLIRRGQLTVIDSRGRSSRFGPGGAPAVVIKLHDRLLPLRLALDPLLVTGKAYMDGRLTIEEGNVRDFLLLATTGLEQMNRSRSGWLLPRLQRLIDRLAPANNHRRARDNVEHHYDIPVELYDLFLDHDRIYSCAYFATGSESLETAQQAKMQHIMAKLLLEPDSKVLDIGCGWGALATKIARETGATVKGVTLSPSQFAGAEARARREQLGDTVEFALHDYRDETQTYDRIVSVGMLEHVGRKQFDRYFAKIAELLDENGVALIHSIGSAIGASDPRSGKDRWLDRYIFPGGYIPALSDVMPAIERAGLWVTDVEILRLHYAETLRHWWDRFAAHRAQAHAMMGERFCRMWEFYLASAETGFRNGRLMVFQLQLSRSRDAVPLTRDYMVAAEQALEPQVTPRRATAA